VVHAGAEFTPQDVLRLLQRTVAHPAVVGFDYRDERGPRSPTGTTRDERYHVPSPSPSIGGLQIYTAVIDDGVQTPEQFATWLVPHGYPEA
jgi:hypothetical protein